MHRDHVEDRADKHTRKLKNSISERKKLDKVLRESESKVLALLNSPSDLAILIEPDGFVLSLNQQAAKVLGKSPGELIGTRLLDLFPDALAKSRKNHMDEVVRSGKPVLFEDQHAGRWFDKHIYPVFDAKGKVRQLAVYTRDITDRKHLEEELRISYNYLDTILMNLRAGIAILEGPEFRYLKINHLLAEINGLPIEDHIGRPLAEVLPDAVDDIIPGLSKVLETGVPSPQREFSTRLPGGPNKTRHFIDSFFPITGIDGKPKAVGAVVIDITERKQAEEALRQANEGLEKRVEEQTAKLAKAIDTLGKEVQEREKAEEKIRTSEKMLQEAQKIAHLGSFEWVIAQNQLSLSPELCRIYGIKSQKFEGTVEEFFSQIHPEDLDKVKSSFKNAVRNHSSFSLEERIKRPDGTVRVLYIAGEVIVGNDGTPVKVIGVCQDITERKLAEHALQESENRLRRIYEAANDAIFVIDPVKNAIVETNTKARKMLGYSEQEFTGLPVRKVHPQEMEIITEFWERIVSGEVIRNDKLTCKAKSGRIFPAEISFSRVVIKDNIYVLALVRDITERKNAEKALKEKESRYRTLYTKTPVMLQSIDSEARIISVSDFWLDTLGYQRDEVIGRRIFDFLTEASRKYAEQVYFPRFLKTNFLKEEELQFRKKNGEVIDVLLSAIAELDEYGKMVRTLAVLIDVTKRKQAEEERDSLRRRNELILNSAGEGIYGVDLDGNVTFVNPAAEKMVGWEKDELIGKTMHSILHHSRVDGTFYPFDECPIIAAFKDGLIYNNDNEVFWRKDGTNFPVEYTSTPMLEKGKIIGAVVVFEDVTKRKQTEEALRESNAKTAAILEVIPDLMFRLSADGTHLDFYSSSLDELYLDPKDFLGKRIDEVLPAEVSQKYRYHIQRAFESSELQRFEYKLAFPEGSRIYESRMVVSGDNETLTIVRNISERKKAEEALKKAHSELKILKDHLEAENIYLQEEIKLEHNFEEFVGQSEKVKKILRKIEQVAPTDSTVLILGETGTGKELIARSIHNLSSRNNRPLVKVNCAALPANLIESELFGHEKGAFTGAFTRKVGRFELADRGTILLDEIGDLSLELQAKLLRVLQEGEFERVGGSESIKIDVRVISATNRNLEKAVGEGGFRADLFYRLNVFPIELPPLRELKEDIPILAHHFVIKHSKRLGKKIDSISKRMMDALQAHSWPGNVRELENIIERAAISAPAHVLKLDVYIDSRVLQVSQISGSATLEEVDRTHIFRVLENANWVVEGKRGAAQILGLHPNTLRAKIKKLSIEKSSMSYH